jgi:hypothetical protein
VHKGSPQNDGYVNSDAGHSGWGSSRQDVCSIREADVARFLETREMSSHRPAEGWYDILREEQQRQLTLPLSMMRTDDPRRVLMLRTITPRAVVPVSTCPMALAGSPRGTTGRRPTLAPPLRRRPASSRRTARHGSRAVASGSRLPVSSCYSPTPSRSARRDSPPLPPARRCSRARHPSECDSEGKVPHSPPPL